MEAAFEDAMVAEYDTYVEVCSALPDPTDRHVLAAALKTRADTLVTENVKHFPVEVVSSFGIEIRTADSFIADTIELDAARAAAAIKRMRERFKKPEVTPNSLITSMDAQGLTLSVDALRGFTELL